jgi:hypothetical protein
VSEPSKKVQKPYKEQFTPANTWGDNKDPIEWVWWVFAVTVALTEFSYLPDSLEKHTICRIRATELLRKWKNAK